MELHRKNEQIEDEVEADLRRRTAGKHVEIASGDAGVDPVRTGHPEAVQDKLAAEQDSARQKTVLENEGMRKRLELQYQAEQEKIAGRCGPAREATRSGAEQGASGNRSVKEESEAAKRVIQARGEGGGCQVFGTSAERKRKAHNQALTPLAVMEKGFEALRALAGTGYQTS